MKHYTEIQTTLLVTDIPSHIGRSTFWSDFTGRNNISWETGSKEPKDIIT